MSAPSIKPLNETKYEEWALAAMAYLQNSGYWGYVEGIELPPLKPFAPPATGTDTNSTITASPYQPESNDPTYLSQFTATMRGISSILPASSRQVVPSVPCLTRLYRGSIPIPHTRRTRRNCGRTSKRSGNVCSLLMGDS
jgi:hypothetical protein